MLAHDLIAQIKRKNGLKTDSQVAKFLGLTSAAVAQWQSPGKNLTPLQMAQAITRVDEKSRKEATLKAHETTIRPIVEFFPLDPTESSQGAKWELFETGKEASRMLNGLRKKLSNSHGIYIFYDSRGRALYAGKANRTKLWAEMKSAFNRSRDTNQVYRVPHPERDQEFLTATEKLRQPTMTAQKLCDLASYVSAFEIDNGMIDNLEALIVRAFANDLLNKNMEKFSSGSKKKARAKVKKT